MTEIGREHRKSLDHLMKGMDFLQQSYEQLKLTGAPTTRFLSRMDRARQDLNELLEALKSGDKNKVVFKAAICDLDLSTAMKSIMHYIFDLFVKERLPRIPFWTVPIPRYLGYYISKMVIDRFFREHLDRCQVAGSIRRQVPWVEDIDVVVIPRDFSKLQAAVLQVDPNPTGGTAKVFFRYGLKWDLVVTNKEWWGAQLFETTGPAGYVIAYRKRARGQGKLLNNKGLYERLPGNKTGKRLAGRSEKSIYKALGKKFKSPPLRGQ